MQSIRLWWVMFRWEWRHRNEHPCRQKDGRRRRFQRAMQEGKYCAS